MPDDNNKPSVPVAHLAKCTVVRCRFHAKEARYRVEIYEDDNLVEVKCLECHPPTPILRVAIDRKRVVT